MCFFFFFSFFFSLTVINSCLYKISICLREMVSFTFAVKLEALQEAHQDLMLLYLDQVVFILSSFSFYPRTNLK